MKDTKPLGWADPAEQDQKLQEAYITVPEAPDFPEELMRQAEEASRELQRQADEASRLMEESMR